MIAKPVQRNSLRRQSCLRSSHGGKFSAIGYSVRSPSGRHRHHLTDLLYVARIAENRINLKFEILDLRDLLNRQEMVQPEIQRHNCQLCLK